MNPEKVATLILQFESNKQINFKLPLPRDIALIWPHLHPQIWKELADLRSHRSQISEGKKRIIKFWQVVKFLFKKSPKSKSKIKVVDFLFIVSGKTLSKCGSQNENWLIQDYRKLLKNSSLMLTENLGSNYLLPESFPDYSAAKQLKIISLITELTYFLIPKRFFSKIDRSTTYFLQHFSAYLNLESTERLLVHMRKVFLREMQFRLLYVYWLNKIQPRFLILEDGSDGTMSGLIAYAKTKKIKVVELQHGWIGVTHEAYNFGSEVVRNLRNYYPDFLLTFGQYWNESINYPGETIAIGKPVFNKFAKKINIESNNILLVISSSIHTDMLIDFCLKLEKLIKSMQIKISFRLHPVEKDFESHLEQIFKDTSIVLDQNSDPYESLNSSTWLIGITSTMLYEAIVFGVKPFSIITEFTEGYIDKKVISTIDSPESFLKKINQISSVDLMQKKYLWNDEPIEQFSNFLHEHLMYKNFVNL